MTRATNSSASSREPGVQVGGLNCNGTPSTLTRRVVDAHAADIRRSIRRANRLGQHRVVTMSG